MNLQADRFRVGLGQRTLAGLLTTMLLPVLAAYVNVWGAPDSSGRPVVAMRVVGNRHTKEWVILRELKTRIGDVADSVQLAEDRDRVLNLKLFERVEVNLVPGPKGDTLVVRVWERWFVFPFPVLFISERDFHKFSYGAGVIHLNVAGRAQELEVVGWAGYNPALHMVYFNPWFGGRHRLFGKVEVSWSSIRSKSLELAPYDEKRKQAMFLIGKRHGYSLYVAGALVYTDRMVRPWVAGVILSPKGRDRFATAVGQVLLDLRDFRPYPWNGTYFEFVLARNGFGSKWVDYTRFETDVRAYFGRERWSLAGRLAVALSWGIVPNYDKLYLGYRERVRGHFFDRYEGENRIMASLEWRRVLLPLRYLPSPFPKSLVPTLKFGLNLAFFLDAGVVWRRCENPWRVPWIKGAGVGLHLRLPYIEALRLELASDEQGNLQGIVDLGAFF